MKLNCLFHVTAEQQVYSELSQRTWQAVYCCGVSKLIIQKNLFLVAKYLSFSNNITLAIKLITERILNEFYFIIRSVNFQIFNNVLNIKNGMIFNVVFLLCLFYSLDSYDDACLAMLHEFRVLLQHSPSPLSHTRLVQLMAINMYMISNTTSKGNAPPWEYSLGDLDTLITISFFQQCSSGNKLNCFIGAREMLSIILHCALVLLFFVDFYIIFSKKNILYYFQLSYFRS